MLSILSRPEPARSPATPAQPEPPHLPEGEFNWWSQLVALARYLSQSEVHTYAFSVAANSILSLFPFIVMMFTLAHKVFHSRAMEAVVEEAADRRQFHRGPSLNSISPPPTQGRGV